MKCMHACISSSGSLVLFCCCVIEISIHQKYITFSFLCCKALHLLRATSHTSQEPWLKLWEPKRKCSKAVPRHPQNHGLWSGVVWRHMWPGPQPNVISMNLDSCGSSRMINENKSTIVSVRSAMVSWFIVRPIYKRWFLKIVQVTLKHGPFDAM